MQCERCEDGSATVYLTGTGSPDGGPDIYVHMCEDCARLYPKLEAALSESLASPMMSSERVRVVSKSFNKMVVRLIRTDFEPEPEEWTLLLARLPLELSLREPGWEFDVTYEQEELEWVQGIREAMR